MSSAANPISSHIEQNIIDSFTCPVTMTLYSDKNRPVLLVSASENPDSCNHTIGEIAADKLQLAPYIVNKPIRERVAKCPICREDVVGYRVNRHVLQLLSETLDRSKETSSLLIPTKISVEEEPEEEIPFPGKGAHFVLSFDQHTDVRNISFESKTAGSLFSTFSFFENPKLSFKHIIINYKNEAAQKFLSDNGLMALKDSADALSTRSEIKKMAQILIKYNEIPEPYLTLLRNFSETSIV